MSWTAIIPLKAPAQRKSRLSTALAAPQREALAAELYHHVMVCVEAAGVFETILTLSPSLSPAEVSARRWVQEHSDLNADLARVRALLSGPLLVLNADLPLLKPAELLALVAAAEAFGSALAADRHGTGTNAVALLPRVPFRFAFGPGSLAAHRRVAPYASVLLRTGLCCDLDTPVDIAHLLASGHPLPERVERLLSAARTPSTVRHVAHVD
jgi:2-phospho-L-lactate guanylyltransferase